MICVSVVAENNDGALQMLERSLAVAELAELRIDRIREPDLPRLIGASKARILITNRMKEEGGFFKGSEQERVNLLKQAVALGAAYVDIEAATGESLMGELNAAIKAHGGATKMILSHHDFHKTPSWRILTGKLESLMAFGAPVVKVVTFAMRDEDNLSVLRLIPKSLKEGQKIIAFCMGEKGRPSRVMAPFLGSFLSYASLERGTEAAPGQLTVAEMKTISEMLHRRHSSSQREMETPTPFSPSREEAGKEWRS